MRDDIRIRIEAVRRGEAPEGYIHSHGYTIPSEWNVVPFGSVFKRSTRKNKSGCENVLTISAQHGLVSQRDYYDKDIASEDKSSYYLMKRGEYAYNKSYSSGYPFGAIKRLEKYEEGIVSPLYICFAPSPNTNTDFYSQYFEGGLYNREIYRFAQEGARNHGLLNIAVEDFFNGVLVAPPEPEQQRIAEILSACDRVIELKHKLVGELQQLKKTCLVKMFPQQGCTIPELRFPGFKALWEERTIKAVFDLLQNNTLSRAELSTEDGAAMNLHYGDILTEFGEHIDVSEVRVPFIASQQTADKFKSSWLQNGDVIMADTAEDETVGKCTEIIGVQDFTVIAGLHTIPLRPKTKFATGYLGYYMNSNAYHNQLLPVMQGIKVTSVSRTAIQDTMISFPSDLIEQAEIGKFFILLDHRIALYEQELEEAQQKKKALMQLLLTGLVRVND